MEPGIRDLFDNIMAYEGDKIFHELLIPWTQQNNYKSYLNTLPDFHKLSDSDQWELYALSRVLDLLTLHFQPDKNADGSGWTGTGISKEEYIDFAQKLGLEVVVPEKYHPFYCEILETSADHHDLQCVFPALKLKNLLIKRSGVIISTAAHDYDPQLINNATIYWAYRRKNRPYHDLSQGWGSNSQWRTAFRLDLETDDSYIYNLNGKHDLNNPGRETLQELKEQNLEKAEAIELLVNRHFTRCKKDDSDLFPYDFQYTESKIIPDKLD